MVDPSFPSSLGQGGRGGWGGGGGGYHFVEVHGPTSVPDASHLVGRHEALPVATEPVTCTGFVILHSSKAK